MRPLIGSMMLVVALLVVAGQGRTVDARGRLLPSTTTIQSDIVGFILQNLTITQGDTINWTNKDGAPHTSTSGTNGSSSGIWDSGTLTTNSSFSFTFNTAHLHHSSIHERHDHGPGRADTDSGSYADPSSYTDPRSHTNGHPAADGPHRRRMGDLGAGRPGRWYPLLAAPASKGPARRLNSRR